MLKHHLKEGIIYVAWGKSGVKEAIASQKYTNMSCSIVTDEIIDGCHFDKVFKVNFPEVFKSYARKMLAMKYSPYSHTLYLDTDCTVLHDLSQGFRLLDRFDIVAVHSPLPFLKIGSENGASHYNTGVLFFNKSDAAKYFFEKWIDTSLNPKHKFRNEFEMDQAAFSLVLYENGIKNYTLPNTWNYRGDIYDDSIKIHGPLVIWHSRSPFPINTLEYNKQFDKDEKWFPSNTILRTKSGYIII